MNLYEYWKILNNNYMEKVKVGLFDEHYHDNANVEYEKGKIIKQSLTIIDELAKLDVEDTDELTVLIDRAKKITRTRIWKLT